MRKNMKKCAKRSKNHAQKSRAKITNKKITKITNKNHEQKSQTKSQTKITNKKL